MIFLPYDSFTIQTSLTPDQVRQKLSNELDTAPLLSWSSITTTKFFRGIVEENKFEITPTILLSSFVPVIKGEIICEREYTQIKVRMLPRFRIPMALLLGGIGFFFFLSLADWLFSRSPTDEILQLGGIFIITYLFLVGGFKLESSEPKEHLRKLFKDKGDHHL